VDLVVVPAIVPAVVRVPRVSPVPLPVVEPPYVPAPGPWWGDDNRGRHLALGHAKHHKTAKHALEVKQLKRAEHVAGKHAKHANHRKQSETVGATEHERAD
jgi:hypothetical protein